ncbi:MAG: alanine/ornithine racemase family PLP-dependent enzyme [Minwuia sp.]|nr:alanine/ornithine racemase family PLP-dependent enzyme [Minwuia sp.]
MTAPRIEIELGKIQHNTRHIVTQLRPHGIDVTGVTKAVCGHPAVARAILDGGATGLAEARIANVARLLGGGMTCPIAMIRSPMMSQAEQVSGQCVTSYNTEMDIILCLAAAARRSGKVHGVVLMVEMGDCREGIMPADLMAFARDVLATTGVSLKGIGANFACLRGSVPNAVTMARFSALATEIEGATGCTLETVSGGNSANLPWAITSRKESRVNDLRLGEAILLGVDPVSGIHIDGLHTDAFTLIAEVIESKLKTDPGPCPVADPARHGLRLVQDNDRLPRSILAIGQQDTDVSGLEMPEGAAFVGATSDHLVVRALDSGMRVGCEVKFHMNYGALMRAMSAPDVAKVVRHDWPFTSTPSPNHRNQCLETA